MTRPPLKPNEVRIERCNDCGEYHIGACAPTPTPANEVKSDLPLYDGTSPLPFVNGYRFRTPDGRTATMMQVEATYTLDRNLCTGGAMIVVFDR